MRAALGQLQTILDDVRQTSSKIASTYTDAETLAELSVAELDAVLADSMKDDAASAGPAAA